MTKDIIRIPYKDVEQYVNQVFLSAGLDEEQTKIISRHLVLANLRGVDSHGISRVSIYLKRLEKGLVEKKWNDILIRETDVSVLIDGGNSMGIPLATKGIKIGVEKAKKHGVGVVGINHSNHCGMVADYCMYAAENDCITLAMTNASANMAPWGGKEKFFGANPIAYGIPTEGEIPIVFDMASSVVAKGKIMIAQKNNKEIPLGWAITKEGKSTNSPEEAMEGLVLPFGGYKGYGITFFIDTLSALFTGAAFGPHIGDMYRDLKRPQNVGQFFIIMRADLFQDLHVFKKRIGQMVEDIKKISLMEGVERIYLPGEIEFLKKTEREENGIPITIELVEELVNAGQAYGVEGDLLWKAI